MKLKRILAAVAVAAGSTAVIAVVAPPAAFAYHAESTSSSNRPCGADAPWNATFSAYQVNDYGALTWRSQYRWDINSDGSYEQGWSGWSGLADDSVPFGPFQISGIPAGVWSVSIQIQSEWYDGETLVATALAEQMPFRPDAKVCDPCPSNPALEQNDPKCEPTTTTTTLPETTTTTTTVPEVTTTTTEPDVTTTTTEPEVTTTTTEPEVTTTTTEPEVTTTTTEPEVTTTTTEPEVTTTTTTEVASGGPTTTTPRTSTTTTTLVASAGPTTTVRVTPTTIRPVTRPGLPATGASETSRLVGFAIALVATGGLVVLTTRRRRTDSI